jgi:hypothetical protein
VLFVQIVPPEGWVVMVGSAKMLTVAQLVVIEQDGVEEVILQR